MSTSSCRRNDLIANIFCDAEANDTHTQVSARATCVWYAASDRYMKGLLVCMQMECVHFDFRSESDSSNVAENAAF